jgi:hypothetical protein
MVRRSAGYPGRDELDRASDAFRRAVAALSREAKYDEKVPEQLADIIARAVQALDELATEATAAAGNSARWKAALDKETAKVERLLKPGAKPSRPRPPEVS